MTFTDIATAALAIVVALVLLAMTAVPFLVDQVDEETEHADVIPLRARATTSAAGTHRAA